MVCLLVMQNWLIYGRRCSRNSKEKLSESKESRHRGCSRRKGVCVIFPMWTCTHAGLVMEKFTLLYIVHSRNTDLEARIRVFTNTNKVPLGKL